MERVIAFHPEIARELGSIPAALLFQQIHYWSQRSTREDGFIYKTMREIEEETYLTRDQQNRARKLLVKLGWLEVKNKKANGVPTLHYKPLKTIEIRISQKLANDVASFQPLRTPVSGKRLTGDYDKRLLHTSATPSESPSVSDHSSDPDPKRSKGGTSDLSGSDVSNPAAVSGADIQEVVDHFMDLQGFLPAQRKLTYKRHVGPAKKLLLAVEGHLDVALRALEDCKRWSGTRSWTLETVLNHLQNFVEYS